MTTIKMTSAKFFLQFPEQSFQKDQVIIHPGDDINHIHYIKNGSVRMYIISPQGDEITLHNFVETSYIPIVVVLTRTRNDYYFQASSKVITYKAPTAKVIQFLKSNPDELFQLVTKFSFAINGLNKRIETLASEDAYHRVFNLLNYFAEKNNNEIQMTHEDIASWLGLKRETVSRQINKLQKEGLVNYQNKKLSVIKITE